jgi:hypothetical protein
MAADRPGCRPATHLGDDKSPKHSHTALSQNQLGEACGISQSAVSRLERHGAASYDTLARAATHLCLPRVQSASLIVQRHMPRTWTETKWNGATSLPGR